MLDAVSGRVAARDRALRRVAERPRERRAQSASSRACSPTCRRHRARADEEILPDELARPWLLPAVYERLSTGRGEFLAELRPAYPVFVSFGGIDYDADESASDKLDDFVRAAQRSLRGVRRQRAPADARRQGRVPVRRRSARRWRTRTTPRAPAPRRSSCAASRQSTAARDIRIGITYGRLRSGTYGHEHRRTFVCLGDAVNLSARLMSKAPAGEIYVSELVRARRGRQLRLGEARAAPAEGQVAPRWPRIALTGSIGRALAAGDPLRAAARRAHRRAGRAGREPCRARPPGRGQIVGISAEAGMGKSRLIAEFVARDAAPGPTRRDGRVPVVRHEHQLLRLARDLAHAARRPRGHARRRAGRGARGGAARGRSGPRPARAAARRRVRPVDPGQRAHALVRRQAAQDVAREPARRLPARAGRAPSRSCWCSRTATGSTRSRATCSRCSRAPWRRAPCCSCSSTGPRPRCRRDSAWPQLPQIEELPLDGARRRRDAPSWPAAKLAQLLEDDTAAAQLLVDLVVDRAQGNPFYVEELLNYVHAQEIDPSDEQRAPLARASRQPAQPGPEPHRHAHASRRGARSRSRASSGASSGPRCCRASTRSSGPSATCARTSARCGLLDLVTPDREEDESYLFKHAVTQEVAYESMPYALRVDLHGHVGRFIEEHEPGGDRPQPRPARAPLLAQRRRAKKREYLRRAGEAAQAAYANAAAIDYFERLAPLLDEADRAAVLLKLGKVLELVGDWAARRGDRARGAGARRRPPPTRRPRPGAETALGRGDAQDGPLRRGDRARWTRAAAAVRAARRRGGARPGAAPRRHDRRAARRLRRCARALRDEPRDPRAPRRQGRAWAACSATSASSPSTTATTTASRDFHERALALRRELGDRWAIAVSPTNLGMIAVLQERYDEAREQFEEAMRLNREVGDAWMVAISHNNLGNANRGLGDLDAARRHYAESLRAYRAYDDKWATAFLLEDVALAGGACRRARAGARAGRRGRRDARGDRQPAWAGARCGARPAAASGARGARRRGGGRGPQPRREPRSAGGTRRRARILRCRQRHWLTSQLRPHIVGCGWRGDAG